MKNKLLFNFIFWLIFYNHIFGQLETQNWYFGNHAGLSFATSPPTALFNGAISTIEGCSVISDNQGNLLFYTDGMFVYNKLHQQMPNGFGLFGDPSSAQSGVIVPKPGSNNVYFIFTVDAEGGPNGFRYSLVDLTLENGLGDVIVGSKNTLLFSPSVEKVAAVSHSNGFFYWVIAHGLNNNSYYAYLLDCNGINPPIISNVGQVEGNPGWGYLASSSDGSKIASAMAYKGFELLDFNNTTGQISNPILLLNPGGSYGISFSPNNEILYGCKIEGGQIYQWDLSSGNPATILASMQQIGVGQGNGYKGGAIQLGLDEKLYIPHNNQQYLSCINNPNIIGVGCNLQHFAINLQGNNARLGLPPFVQSFFSDPTSINSLISCDSVSFSLDPATISFDSLQWDFGDSNSGLMNNSNSVNPSHQYSTPGNYIVTLIKYFECVSDTITYNLILDSVSTNNYEQIVTCDSVFYWNGNYYNQSGNYMLYLTNSNGCDSIVHLDLSINFVEIQSTDTIVCGQYSWNGQQINQTGIYEITTNSMFGCDSTCLLNISIYPDYFTSLSYDICPNESYLFNNTYYSTEGTYFVPLQTNFGCDSIIELHINVKTKPPVPSVNFEIPYCPVDTIYFQYADIVGECTVMNPQGQTFDLLLDALPVTIAIEGNYLVWQVLDGCNSDTLSFEIELNELVNIENLNIPNVITPNNDQINDIFDLNKIIHECFPYSIKIMNRWGNIVFQGNENSSQFNGKTMEGKELIEGIYFYQIQIDNQNLNGFFYLLR